MAASISVIGVQDGMGGLKESVTKFRKHHEEVGAALLNISGVGTVTGDKVDKDELRPSYNPAEHQWPRMIYHADGREEIVANDNELKALVQRGFRKEPYPKPKVYVADPQVEKKAMLEQNQAQAAQIATQGDVINRLMERLAALEAKK